MVRVIANVSSQGEPSPMRTPLLVLVLIGLVACNQDELLQKFASPDDQAIAKGYIDHLRGRKFEEIEKALDPSIRTANIRDTLTKMADLIPDEGANLGQAGRRP
jgi:hypothetical protein